MVTLRELSREMGIGIGDLAHACARAGIEVFRIPAGFGGKTWRALDDLDADALRRLLRDARGARPVASARPPGTFYAVQPDPDAAPSVVKLGFASSLERRLADYRTSSPKVRVVASWPCLRRWEPTAMDSIAVGCRRLGPEVFDVPDLAALVEAGNRFFAGMPKL